METKEWKYTVSDGKELAVYTWTSDATASVANQQEELSAVTNHRSDAANDAAHVVVHILHGMAEHSKRYDSFAQRLVQAGYTVYAHDHRGHGRTAKVEEDKGFFAASQGWDRVVKDAQEFASELRRRHPNAKVIGFGHSMGSFLLRSVLQRSEVQYEGVILSGTGGDPGSSALAGLALAKLEMMLRGTRAKSKLMNQLLFGTFIRSFKPQQTPFDWLSRDAREVQKYIDDPDCGQVFATSFYADLITGLRQLYKHEEAKCVSPSLPVLLFSGDNDPVGGFGQGVRQVYERFRTQGFADVTLRLYPEGRHEMLNETNKEEVTQDILTWLKEHFH